MKDYYKILELPFGASSSEIKSAYRKLAFKYHPDKNFNDKNAEEIFKEITEAYSVLSDDNRRIIYHADYNDFLNNRYINRIPNTTYQSTQYARPTDIPTQPRGPASSYRDNFNGIRIMILSAFVFLIIFLLIKSNTEIKEREQKRQAANESIISMNDADTISEDEFYKIISQEFMLSNDSALLKSNIDSLRHVFDSLQKVSNN